MTPSCLPQAALGLGCGALLAACAGGEGRTSARAPSTAPMSAASLVDPRAQLAAGIDAIFSGYGGVGAGARAPGCSVGVYRAGEIAYSRGYGFADLEHDAPNTDTTLFHLASIAKQFSAAAVLLLVQDGKLALGDDVRKYVPELPDHGTRITLDQLLHHTSGVRDYGLLLELQGGGGVDLVTAEDILWLLAHQRGENFVPGTRYLYSNSGYVLLSLVVERASGKTYGAFVKERIFDPLGMTDTLVKDDHAQIIPRRAVGYARRPDGTYRTATSNTEYTGQGNILSTARDLAKWDANFYAPKVGGAALVGAMRILGRLTDGTPIEYAMGLVEDVARGLPRESHSGGLAGYRTRIARYPTEKLTVTVLCNDGSANVDVLEKKVASLFLPALGAPAVADPAAPAGTGQGGPVTRPVPDGQGEGIPAPRFDEYVGRYGSEELARDLEIVVKDGHLVRRTWGGRFATAPLRPTSRDVFSEDEVVWTFERDTHGSVRGIVVSSERTRGVHLQKR